LVYSDGTVGCGGIARKTTVILRCGGLEKTTIKEIHPCDYVLELFTPTICTRSLTDCVVKAPNGKIIDFSVVPYLTYRFGSNLVTIDVCRSLDISVRNVFFSFLSNNLNIY
jgi:hypothetical protein